MPFLKLQSGFNKAYRRVSLELGRYASCLCHTIQSFILQIVIEQLLCASHHVKHWEHTVVLVLMEFTF